MHPWVGGRECFTPNSSTALWLRHPGVPSVNNSVLCVSCFFWLGCWLLVDVGKKQRWALRFLLPSLESIYNFRGESGAHPKPELEHLARRWDRSATHTERAPCSVEGGLGPVADVTVSSVSYTADPTTW